MSRLLPHPLLVASLGVLMLVCMDASMKELLASLPVGQSVFLRYAAALPFAGLAWTVRTRRHGERLGDFSLLHGAARGLLMAVSAMLFFFAVTVMPLAEVIAITFMAPFFVALIARLFLREAVAASLLFGMALSFVGLLLVLGGQWSAGHGPALVWGAVGALVSTVTYAASNVMTRHQAASAPIEWVVFVPIITATAALSPFGAFGWEPVNAEQAALFVFCGLLGTAGHLMLAWAFARVAAAQVAVLDYTAFVWAALIAWVAFGEVPTLATVAGACVIVMGCLVALRQPAASATPIASRVPPGTPG